MLFFRGNIYPVISAVGKQACEITKLMKNPRIQGQSRHFCTSDRKLAFNSDLRPIYFRCQGRSFARNLSMLTLKKHNMFFLIFWLPLGSSHQRNTSSRADTLCSQEADTFCVRNWKFGSCHYNVVNSR